MTDQRDIGTEVLEGIRQLKRGESGRAMSIPSVRSIRDKTGLSWVRPPLAAISVEETLKGSQRIKRYYETCLPAGNCAGGNRLYSYDPGGLL